METREYRTKDKSKWGAGPWQDEPDKKQWTDPDTHLPCLVVRGPSGALCGYVGVTEGHPWFAEHYGKCDDVDVHGGLTFADFCMDTPEGEGVCHAPAPNEPHRVWWLGFDCNHAWDLAPRGMSVMRQFWEGDEHGTYRDFAYVERHVTKLALQVRAAAKAGR